jgi:hypothetical protein
MNHEGDKGKPQRTGGQPACEGEFTVRAANGESEQSIEYPTGKQMLQSGGISAMAQSLSLKSTSVNHADNADGRFRTLGKRTQEREFNRKWNNQLIAGLKER